MATHRVTTARLLLRPLEATDASALHALWTAPDVRRYLWDDQVIPSEQTREILAASASLFEERGFGLWAVTGRDGEPLLGFGGFWFFRDPPELELVVGLAAGHWGRGLATEAARALIGHAFDRLGFSEVRASTDTANEASVRLMERLGMTFERREGVSGLDTVFYRVSEAEWRRRHASS